ncbi:MAG TPA: FkbM family methyltransferase [Stellaceae bacterium]|nr:FkbM family methyltransferase [Stellaceae bacterium]
MARPIYAGAERALARLESGEYVCVDTHSLDSIDYLLGWPLEMHCLPVFRRFLQPASVVLDVGANFGLYTAAAASFVKDRGRLYAFEPNPHTFTLLQRTLYANRLTHNPNIVAVNALVGEERGRRTLHYAAEALGGATVIDIGQWGAAERSVEVDMITLDDFLPTDLRVDLVKIDVEGHEPFVLRGMRQIIRRSPNIRIFLEFVEDFLAHTIGADAFLAEIAAQGLALCEVVPGALLARVGPGERLRGAHFCLLTRTPDADIAHARRQGGRLGARLANWLRRNAATWERRRHALYRL